MAYQIGLNVVEVDGAGAPSIRGAATSVGAFNVLTQRGVPNRPTRVSSYQKFVEQFGGYTPSGLGAYLLRGFYDNGGRTAYINRVVAQDAMPASFVLNDAVNPTLRLEAGYRGHVDPGHWADDLYVQIAPNASTETRVAETAPAELTGGALPAVIDLSALDPLQVLVDGATIATDIAFVAADFAAGPANATREQIRDAINAKTTAFVAALSGADELVLTSTGEGARLNGTWTRLEIATAYAELGFAAGDSADATLAVLQADQTTVQQADGFAVGDAVEVSDGTTTEFV
ncbi:MAG: hypothetical protein HKN04_08780, partial [Rhodothermaceae bacterium]|nr:hypothetical protein [Rhodothermaceae bacterium]